MTARAVRSSNARGARIFVQIPAYRDTELARTLTALFARAARPDELRVVVLWQRAEHETLPVSLRRRENLELIEVPYTESLGCNWARSVLQKRWCGEPYTLLLDSHHRFVTGWDERVVAMYEGLRARGVRRPLVTAYLPPYVPETEPIGRKRSPYRIYPLEWQEGMLVRLTSHPIPFWRALREPVPADFLSLHFLFTDGRFNEDVPFDPHTYFVGDEVSMSIRAYTSGFELYHPHRVLGWHSYDRSSRVTHWTDHDDWRELNERSLARLRRLFRGRMRGRYGAGTRRSVSRYEEYLQLELVQRAYA